MVDGAAEVAINAIYSILEQEDRPLEDWEDVGGIDVNTGAYIVDLFKELKIFDNPELESKTYRLIDVDVEKKVAKSFKNAIKERNKKGKKSMDNLKNKLKQVKKDLAKTRKERRQTSAKDAVIQVRLDERIEKLITKKDDIQKKLDELK